MCTYKDTVCICWYCSLMAWQFRPVSPSEQAVPNFPLNSQAHTHTHTCSTNLFSSFQSRKMFGVFAKAMRSGKKLIPVLMRNLVSDTGVTISWKLGLLWSKLQMSFITIATCQPQGYSFEEQETILSICFYVFQTDDVWSRHICLCDCIEQVTTSITAIWYWSR